MLLLRQKKTDGCLQNPKAAAECLRFLTVCILAAGKADMARAWVAIQTQMGLAADLLVCQIVATGLLNCSRGLASCPGNS